MTRIWPSPPESFHTYRNQSTKETEPSVVDARVAGSVAIVSKELATGGLGANIGRVQVYTKHLARTPDDLTGFVIDPKTGIVS